ncbi:glycosyltransferase family A protein [Flavobacterium anhuiense]|uniref:glycosyltransferase family A protein n=1 Tax=Flavobacterium anhuiense TaxID=459526 RepID=UPI0020262664|nr:glycosyltransferase family A protein [Flavobacterium anhuiense]URM37354.1 glycosyltransferase family 2 protein [Flavobacterium anhuiense]
MLAPIVIYTYNRIEHLKKTVDSLRSNYLATDSVLIIVSDGCGRTGDEQSIIDIRSYINSIIGFKEVIGEFRETNFGAIGSVLEAEKRLVNKYGRIISMEDDNVCSKNFLDYMNQALEYYDHDETVFSVCGYCPPVLEKDQELKQKSDYYNYYWNLSWGYGIWKDKYNKLYSLNNDYELLKREGVVNKIKKLGGRYLVDAVKRDFKYNADFPDAWLGAKMTYLNCHSIIPSISKVQNIGSDGSGHHKGILVDKFNVVLDDGIKRKFDFATKPKDNPRFIAQMLKFYNGKFLGRISRYLGIYHYVLTLKRNINA